MKEEISFLLKYLCGASANTAIIDWAPPIPAFGNPETAQVATLGLNPSSREFVDKYGNELDGPVRRFPSLRSFELTHWRATTDAHVTQIAEACRSYFQRNPYNAWFARLDFVISKTGMSYYNPHNNAVHLDLVPYATHQKWARLSHKEKRSLAEGAGSQLGLTVRDAAVTLVVLNGMTVVREFQCLCRMELCREKRPDWALSRIGGTKVPGYGFCGVTEKIGKVALGRELLVLGFNHNVQSSYGVSGKVCEAIRDWVGAKWRGGL